MGITVIKKDGGGGSGGITADGVATLTNKTINADNNTISNIDNNEIKASAGIDATKIADGSISNTEFQYLNGVTSNIQTQLDAAGGAWDYKYLTAAQSFSSTTTLTNVTELQHTSVSAGLYLLYGRIYCDTFGSSTPGLKLYIELPSQSRGLILRHRKVDDYVDYSTATFNFSATQINAVTGTEYEFGSYIEVFGTVKKTSGTFNTIVQFAQSTSNASNSNIREGSFLGLMELA